MSLIAVSNVSILKWWYVTDSFSFFRLNITLWDPSFLGLVKIGDMTWPSSCDDSLIIPLRRNFSTSLSMIVCSISVKEQKGLVTLVHIPGSQSNSIWQWVTASKIKGSDVIVFHTWRQSRSPPALKGIWFAIIVARVVWLTSAGDPTGSWLPRSWDSAGAEHGSGLDLKKN